MQIIVTCKSIRDAIANLGPIAEMLSYEQWTYNAKAPAKKIKVDMEQLSLEEIDQFYAILKANEEDEAPKVKKLLTALNDVENKVVPSMSELPAFLKAYLKANGNPLLHSLYADQRGVAYLPISITFEPGKDRYNSKRDEPYVVLELGYNNKKTFRVMSIHISRRDITRMTVPAILKNKNLMVPDETMTDGYEKIKARFNEYSSSQGEQFWCRGEAPVMTDRDSYWWSASHTVEMTHMGKPTKAVIDIEGPLNGDRYMADHRSIVASEIYDERRAVPIHPVLPMFSLAHHKTVWVNVVNMKPYKYETNLREKLVLPKSHVRLIGALVSNLDVLRDEEEADDRSRTIQAKAKSSIILAMGPAGTGKTLTAEVYAEEIKRPLYEIQSGQIGTEPEQIESNLQIILNRAIRLNMPVLINEADVFIQKRGRDLVQNAVVSVFLRVLEYHDGLVFLTTNRAEDIDDAVLSRCIAEIKYGIPAPTEKLRLWQVMLGEFNLELATSELRRAVLLFPDVVGRDIQNLLRLTNRVCKATDTKFDLQALRENAVFKSVHALSDEELEAEVQVRVQATAARKAAEAA